MQSLRSYQLAVAFYRVAREAKLPPFLRDQLRRAASSVALNLSEGYGRRTMRDRVRFFSIAFGSIRECQTVVNLEGAAFDQSDRDLLDHLAASTYRLIRRSRLE